MDNLPNPTTQNPQEVVSVRQPEPEKPKGLIDLLGLLFLGAIELWIWAFAFGLVGL